MWRDDATGRLDETDAGDDPAALFARWFEEAKITHSGAWYETNSMTLATVDAEGRPDARIVLLKEFADGSFVFYTNTASAKGEQLAANPRAALVFHWPHLERQVRIRGPVERVRREQAEAYFRSRPAGSRIGAAASDQSQPVADRGELENRAAALQQEYGEGEIPMPQTWGGYRVTAEEIEFWQGRADRLHDRLRYRRDKTGWTRQRLSP